MSSADKRSFEKACPEMRARLPIRRLGNQLSLLLWRSERGVAHHRER